MTLNDSFGSQDSLKKQIDTFDLASEASADISDNELSKRLLLSNINSKDIPALDQ